MYKLTLLMNSVSLILLPVNIYLMAQAGESSLGHRPWQVDVAITLGLIALSTKVARDASARDYVALLIAMALAGMIFVLNVAFFALYVTDWSAPG